jgi:hypothetical protein
MSVKSLINDCLTSSITSIQLKGRIGENMNREDLTKLLSDKYSSWRPEHKLNILKSNIITSNGHKAGLKISTRNKTFSLIGKPQAIDYFLDELDSVSVQITNPKICLVSSVFVCKNVPQLQESDDVTIYDNEPCAKTIKIRAYSGACALIFRSGRVLCSSKGDLSNHLLFRDAMHTLLDK